VFSERSKPETAENGADENHFPSGIRLKSWIKKLIQLLRDNWLSIPASDQSLQSKSADRSRPFSFFDQHLINRYKVKAPVKTEADTY